jgi:acetyltransferase EpsM
MPEPIVIWGASGHAKVVADAVRMSAAFEVVGFIDDVDLGRIGSRFLEAEVLGGPDALEDLLTRGVRALFVAIGDCQARLVVASRAERMGFRLPALVHPAATVASDVEIGEGTIVVAGAVVNSGTVLGKGVIVNTAASVDHDCILEDGVHVSPGAHLAGGVRVGRGAWIGLGALVRDGARIGSESVVGMGSVVTRDLPSKVIAYGVPARIVRRER